MRKAVILMQRFGLFAPKAAGDAPKDDMFTLRLERLRRVQAQQATGVVFKNRRLRQGA